ncbi:THUMP domain-containing protein 1 homolog isoform X2 [Phoenix dactylifera]|uniref:THUMP domain-containing protein 1 homolog isoform X2 n=1 Tax=Phoenix dactylifera TaxID=42345 RepID=A0A8B7CJ45_PHODC|nr:THUMP domain-containing protein 1 homolog isoform X2 [Phoenix dactylifera]
MAAENKPNSIFNNSKGRKRKYLPHGKPVRKGSYPLRPGVLGFFLTCDGGRERQATNEALNLLETFYEELVNGKDSSAKCRTVSSKPLNKIIKFKDSDSSSDEDEASPHGEESDTVKNAVESEDTPSKEQQEDVAPCKEELDTEKHAENEELPSKKQRLETDTLKCAHTESDKSNDKPIDELIEDELQELGDRNKRHFVSLESGCNGVVFIQMHKRGGDPGPVDIVHHMMSSAASTRKHMSRFILRVLPAEVTCYASEEEIKNAIKPLIEQYFPSEASTPSKFAVLYEARANTGIERMAIINAVAKSVPQPHKVDLSNPDKTIIVQIVKTICLVGVVERYKELSKYNLRQLTSPQQ